MNTRLQVFQIELFQNFWKKTSFQAIGFLEDKQTAKDVASDVLLILLENTAHYNLLDRYADADGHIILDENKEIVRDENGQSLQALVYTILKRRCIDIKKNKKKVCLIDNLHTIDKEQEEIQELMEEGIKMDEFVAALKENANKLLTQSQQQIFNLHCLNGYTLKEISCLLRLPITAVHRRWYHAKVKLISWRKANFNYTQPT